MVTELAVRYLHFASILTLVGAVLAQHWGLRSTLTRRQVGRLQRMDVIYAVSVVVVLATGFLQWLAVGKPAAFYSPNPVFHTKITLFLIVGRLSAYPGVFLARQRKGEADETVAVPPLVVWSIRGELLLRFAMPLLATLMARGIGLPTGAAP